MPKNMERNELEFLRGEVRRLKAELKRMKRLAARASKQSRQDNDLISEYVDEMLQETDSDKCEYVKCPKCESPKFAEIDLGIKKIDVCQDCGYNKVRK